MTTRVVLCFPVESHHMRQIADVADDLEVVDAGQGRIAKEILRADLFCGHAKVPVPWADVVREGRLRWIQSSAAGMDHCLTPEVVASDIVVTSASGLFANQVAEQTLALTLGLIRGLPTSLRQQQAKRFERHATCDLHGRTVGIVGLGGNGRRLVDIFAAFGTRILATDWLMEDQPAAVEKVYPADQLDRLLPQVDLLVLAVPLTAHTQGMIDRQALAKLPRGALLINVARGQVVVEADLVEALRSGQLGGAGLDVTEVEPLPETSPLWTMPNVIITPHMGALSDRRTDDTVNFFCENLRRWRAQQPLLNLVDKQLGFPRKKLDWPPLIP